MDEQLMAKEARPWSSHQMQQHSRHVSIHNAAGDEVDITPLESQALLPSPRRPHVGGTGGSSLFPIVHNSQPGHPFVSDSGDKLPSIGCVAAECSDSVGVGTQVALNDLCRSTHMAAEHRLDNLLSFSNAASHTNDALQPDFMTAAPASTASGHHQLPAGQDTPSQSARGSPLDFAFLDAPSMPYIPGGSPSHDLWSHQPHTVVLEDPLMHPLPFMHGTHPASHEQHMLVPLPAAGHAESLSPGHHVNPLDGQAGGFLPFATHPTGQGRGGSQHAPHGDCQTASAHSVCMSQAVYNSTEPPIHLSNVPGRVPVPVHMHSSAPAMRPEVQSNGHSGNSSFPTNHQAQVSQPQPAGMKSVQTTLNTSGKLIGPVAAFGIRTHPGEDARRVGSPADTYDSPFCGLQSMDKDPTPSLFDWSQKSHQKTRSIASSKEHSLRILHTTLCNVGSVSERSLALGAAVQQASNGDMGPPVTNHRSSHFKPVMIPSNPARVPTLNVNQPSDALWQPLCGEADGCSKQDTLFPASDPSFSNIPQLPSLHSVTHRSMLGHSEGASTLGSNVFAIQGIRCQQDAAASPSMQMISHNPRNVPAVDVTGPLNIQGIHYPNQPDHGNLDRQMHHGSAPGRMLDTGAGAAFGTQHLEDFDTMAGGGDCMHECTVRGGRALQAQLQIDRRVSALRPVLRAAPAGRSAPRRSGSSLEGRSKRSAKTLSEMVAAADAVSAPEGVYNSNPAYTVTDTSLHSSSKRTRTSPGAALMADPSLKDDPASSSHTGHTTGLTGSLEQFHVSEVGGSTQGFRSRRTRLGLDPKEEHSLQDWVALIAREEGGGNETVESHLREEFLHWETRSKCAPNGKWRGANSRKWGKVGIEMRLTGSVPRTEGPQTHLGKMVCKFVDVVEVKDCSSGVSQDNVPSCGQDARFNCGSHNATLQAVPQAPAIALTLASDVGDGCAAQNPPAPHGSSMSPEIWTTSLEPKPLHVAPQRNIMPNSLQCSERYVWRLAEVVDKQGSGVRTVLKEKVWLGTYHTPINAAVHHDFYKVVLAVEGCIYTSVDVPACSAPTGKKKSQKLKLNFPLADLPELMYKAVRFTQLWNKYKQDAERYVFRTYDPETVRSLVRQLIDSHCGELHKHVANNDCEGTVSTVERRSTRTRSTVPQADLVDSTELEPLDSCI